ncbi:MAG: hypothetical protein LBU58_05185, partial [Clostridiales bacterium]|nr:hypothetical protein [Clostridiales bacterium]
MYDAAITNKDIENKNIRQIRRRIIDMTFAAGTVGAHIGGSLSAVEILYALYFAVLNIAPDNLASELR